MINAWNIWKKDNEEKAFKIKIIVLENRKI